MAFIPNTFELKFRFVIICWIGYGQSKYTPNSHEKDDDHVTLKYSHFLSRYPLNVSNK